jgi:tetratricopeptide (TPR) repeat protein
LGKISYDEGNNEAALTYFSLVPAADSPLFFNKANEIAADIHFTQRDFGQARAIYEALIAATADVNKKIYYEAQKLRCLVNEGNAKLLGSGMAAFQRQYKNHPEFDSYLASVEFEEGKRDYLSKNFDSALRHFSTILKKYKRSGYADDALYYQGLCYTTLNKSDDALDKLTKFLKEYPNSSIIGDVYITIANLYIRGEKTELAMSALQKAVETAAIPESKMNALSSLMKLYKNLGMWDSALRMARQYVEQFPNAEDIVDTKILIGICLTSLNRYSEAIDYLKKVKFEATAEQEPEIQFYVGEAYFNAGRYEEAIGEFVKIPLLSKKTKLQWEASALYYSGQAYEKLARVDDAVRMYREIVERPGILLELKREAQHRIEFLTN